VGVEPFGDARNVLSYFIELDEAQRHIGTVVLQKCLETFGGREVLEGQRALAAVVAPQHAVPVRFFWAWMLATALDVTSSTTLL
jgi:hypothetical protein